jgi:hypothetical protein
MDRRVGNTTFAPNDPSLYAATVANKILGGGSDARLFLILREQKSWTYGAYSNLAQNRNLGYFQATAEVRNAVTDSVLGEMLSQLDRIGTQPATGVEIEAAKNALTGSFPLTIETVDQVAAQVTSARLLGRPADYVQNYRTRLAAVTPAQITAAADRVIRPDRALIVVVGDGQQIYDELTKFGPVKIVAPDGTPLTPADLKPAAAGKLALAPLAPFRDSLVVMVQGKEFGYQVKSLEKTADGFRYMETQSLGPIGTSSMTATFSAAGEPRTVTRTGKLGGQDVKGDVVYTAGRVKGSSTTPTQQGPKTVTFDTTVAAGTLDDASFGALLPSLAWAPNAKITANIFSASKGMATPVTLAVTGTESVTVPAGTFQAYHVDLTGGEAPLTIYVTVAAPHRVIRVAPVGQPVEFVLAK